MQPPRRRGVLSMQPCPPFCVSVRHAWSGPSDPSATPQASEEDVREEDARMHDHPARAADKPAGDEAKKPAPEPPKAEQSVTQHSVVIGGKTIDYAATAGTLIVRNDKDEPTAAIGYIAYTLRGAGDPGRRPITFAYN